MTIFTHCTLAQGAFSKCTYEMQMYCETYPFILQIFVYKTSLCVLMHQDYLFQLPMPPIFFYPCDFNFEELSCSYLSL